MNGIPITNLYYKKSKTLITAKDLGRNGKFICK